MNKMMEENFNAYEAKGKKNIQQLQMGTREKQEKEKECENTNRRMEDIIEK